MARPKQRLIVCLDGTWNRQDDSTNVLHHFTLTADGPDEHGVVQRKFYQPGVGTGVLDSISGGAFGFGLEANVRAAYDWLAANYNDGPDPESADEVFIFGFSRGAYTARSLVGFIATCGLVKRGAPLSITQLWDDYRVLGRQKEKRSSIWDALRKEPKVRRITELIADPWNIEAYEAHRLRRLALKGHVAVEAPERRLGQLVDCLNNDSEKLLVRWSRRIRITYLGVYDTVGALGLDALAIPGVQSRLAAHHNMHPTRIVCRCRHALAVDEHRSSFKHTPFVAFEDHGDGCDDEQERAMRRIVENPTGSDDDDLHGWDKVAGYRAKVADMWVGKIEQRWFTGAHANIGGGYADNELAQLPLVWLLEGARDAHLKYESLTTEEDRGDRCQRSGASAERRLPGPKDSYADFVKPIWTDIVRGKRLYRKIAPEPELRARSTGEGATTAQPAGFGLHSINEQIDDSVFTRVDTDPKYRPANLVEYARRKLLQNGDLPYRASLQTLSNEPPAHQWCDATPTADVVLVLWATLAGMGVVPLLELFAPGWPPSLPSFVPPWLFGRAFIGTACGLLAAAFALVDWGESRANLALAVGTFEDLGDGCDDESSARWRAFLDSLYWARTVAFVLAVLAVTSIVALLLTTGWNGTRTVTDILTVWWPAPILAGIGALAGHAIDRRGGRRLALTAASTLGAAAILALAVPAFVAIGAVLGALLKPAIHVQRIVIVSPAPDAAEAGMLLFVLCLTGYALVALRWAAEPMCTANLGSIVRLQRCWTPSQVYDVLESWRASLANRWSGKDDDVNGPAGLAMRGVVREALWRDLIGFILVYGGALFVGVWYALDQFGTWIHASSPAWPGIADLLRDKASLIATAIWLPLITVVADYVEDTIHLRYLTLHSRKTRPAGLLAGLSYGFTLVKMAGFAVSLAITGAGVASGVVDALLMGESLGWRGSLALLICAFATAMILLALAPFVVKAVRRVEQGVRARWEELEAITSGGLRRSSRNDVVKDV